MSSDSGQASFLQQLFDQKIIKKRAFSVQLEGQNRNLLLGGYDYVAMRKFEGTETLLDY